ncbi:MAG: 2-methylaconitate cis-trans isomerase PrpF family protein [Alphaproteobacteria bacterium]
MEQLACPAVFMRGGNSKGLFFRAEDLPPDPVARERFLLRATGSPDPNGRQPDGMGGGISSLSKVMIVSRSGREGVDVDYDFGQIAVGEPMIDRTANCGNLSAAVGVFAVEAGSVTPPDGEAVLRMLNVNTQKRVDCVLQIAGGHARVRGDCKIAGVAGTGAPIRLDFLEPGGAGTGALLPTGAPVDMLELPDGTSVAASIIDATNLCVFVRAADLGLAGTELPTEFRNKPAVIARLEAIRGAAAVKAGVADSAREAARTSPVSPKVAMVAAAADAPTLSGAGLRADECDIQVRMISMGAPHLAIPLTGALCTGVAAQVAGTLVRECARPVASGEAFRIGHGSGVLPVEAVVTRRRDGWFAERASVYRTARVLMEGRVFASVEALEVVE